jgi:hypothetical protein
MNRTHRPRLARFIWTGMLAVAMTAPAAQAATEPVAVCEPRAFAPVFAAWGDGALYTLAPGGGFETGAGGWTLTGGAAVVAGSSPFAAGRSSLSLPAGASALSPPICVQKEFPSWRFAARSAGGRVDVAVVYARMAVPGRVVKSSPSWSLAPIQRLATGQFVRGGHVQLKVTAVGGAVGVDDVYVDPRYRR